MKTKTFDCVQMKRRAAERIHEETKGLTLEEKIDYWRGAAKSFFANKSAWGTRENREGREVDHAASHRFAGPYPIFRNRRRHDSCGPSRRPVAPRRGVKPAWTRFRN